MLGTVRLLALDRGHGAEHLHFRSDAESAHGDSARAAIPHERLAGGGCVGSLRSLHHPASFCIAFVVRKHSTSSILYISIT